MFSSNLMFRFDANLCHFRPFGLAFYRIALLLGAIRNEDKRFCKVFKEEKTLELFGVLILESLI